LTSMGFLLIGFDNGLMGGLSTSTTRAGYWQRESNLRLSQLLPSPGISHSTALMPIWRVSWSPFLKVSRNHRPSGLNCFLLWMLRVRSSWLFCRLCGHCFCRREARSTKEYRGRSAGDDNWNTSAVHLLFPQPVYHC
jgi:hypothetical protein